MNFPRRRNPRPLFPHEVIREIQDRTLNRLAGPKRNPVVHLPFSMKPKQLHMLGKHDDIPDSDFSAYELALGIREEMEHTDSVEIATAIAKDHLAEDPQYYSKLQGVFGPPVRGNPSMAGSAEDVDIMPNPRQEVAPPTLPISEKAVIADVTRILYDLAHSSIFEEDVEDVDVRLQLQEDGSYDVHYGDSQYDTDHRGFWGASSISNGAQAEECRSVAEELVKEAVESYWESR